MSLKDFDKYIKDHKLDLASDTLKAAYESEDLNKNFLGKAYPDAAGGIEKVKLDDVLVTVSDSDVAKCINVIRNVFDITGTITSADSKADLSDITVILLDSEGNEVNRTVAEPTGEGAVYSFRGLAQGSYTVRIDSSKVKADDIAADITDTDVTADITVSAAYLIGDVNSDGAVDIFDALLVQKFTAGRTTFTEKQLYVADVNDDGSVDILDAAQIQKFAAGRITEFKKKA